MEIFKNYKKLIDEFFFSVDSISTAAEILVEDSDVSKIKFTTKALPSTVCPNIDVTPTDI